MRPDILCILIGLHSWRLSKDGLKCKDCGAITKPSSSVLGLYNLFTMGSASCCEKEIYVNNQ